MCSVIYSAINAGLIINTLKQQQKKIFQEIMLFITLYRHLTISNCLPYFVKVFFSPSSYWSITLLIKGTTKVNKLYTYFNTLDLIFFIPIISFIFYYLKYYVKMQWKHYQFQVMWTQIK